MGHYILILNTGSSSVKFRVFGMEDNLPLVAGGKVTDIGTTPAFKASKETGGEHKVSLPVNTSHADSVKLILQWLAAEGISAQDIAAAAHRIVHGGDRYVAPILLEQQSMDYLRSLAPLAPLHQPHNLSGMDIFANALPNVPQYACFDTAFHAEHDEMRASFALPAKIRNRGVRRYGFHGLSYAWVAHCLKTDYPHLSVARVVAAHLGNGASLCAIKNMKSVDTTMGMTALDGLPMGTRSGAIDAGAVFYMINHLGLGAAETERILYEDSGLKGLSGISNDVKTLSESEDERAAFALDYFCLKTAQNIAGMAVSIGGMDALVFTGGIGENAPTLRDKIMAHLSFMPRFEHLVIAANEERGMAQDIFRKLRKEL